MARRTAGSSSQPLSKPFEGTIEEAEASLRGVRAVVGAPFAIAVGIELLAAGAGAAEHLERSPRMQRVIGEAGAHQYRHLDPREVRGERLVPIVALGPGNNLVSQMRW